MTLHNSITVTIPTDLERTARDFAMQKNQSLSKYVRDAISHFNTLMIAEGKVKP